MDVDPLASMRCWALTLELGGRTYDIPALSAADWWPVLMSGDPLHILDFVQSSPEDPFNLDDLLLDGTVTGEDLSTTVMDAIEVAAGRSMHATYLLVMVAGTHWASINGALVRRGFRWADQPLGAALDAIYAEVTGRMEKDDLTKFLALLENEALTTPGKRGARNREKLASEFETIAGPRPKAGAVATGAPSDSARSRTRKPPPPPRQDDP